MFYLCNIHFSIVALNTLFRYIKSASALKFLLTGLIKFPPRFVQSINEAIILVPLRIDFCHILSLAAFFQMCYTKIEGFA